MKNKHVAKDNDLLSILLGSRKTPSSFIERNRGRVLEYYLTGTIEDASEYVEWFNSIRHAEQNDVVKIYINSPGGDLYTAIQFMRILRDTQATVIASVEGECNSAATIIFLAADKFEVTQHSSFMFHNYSGATFGKGGEMIDQLVHERKWSEVLFKDVYADFLSPQEIADILNSKDIWMDAQTVVDRIEVRAEAQKAKAKVPDDEESDGANH